MGRNETYRGDLALGVQALNVVVQRIFLADKDSIRTERVAGYLGSVELVVDNLHLVLQPLRINKGQQGNSLPQHLLSIHVHLKFEGVKVLDGRVRISHKVMERLGEVDATAEREISIRIPRAAWKTRFTWQ